MSRIQRKGVSASSGDRDFWPRKATDGPEHAADFLPQTSSLMDADFDLESLTNVEEKFAQCLSVPNQCSTSLLVSISPVIKTDIIMVACMD
jgi:hypothetical protein